MMKDSGKSTSLHVKKTQKARLRRLEILRMRPGNLTHENDSDREGDAKSTSSASSIDSPELTRRHGSFEFGGSSSSPAAARCESSGLLYGHVSVMGRRRMMEDTVTVAPHGWLAGEYSFFAVYDGHGGARVAEKCRDRMHKSLESLINKAKTAPAPSPEGKAFDWEKVMAECFRSMDQELLEDDIATAAIGEHVSAAEKMVGSTAVVVVVGKNEVVVANCGDSRAVLCRGGAPAPLSRDHKPDSADEKERIEAAGGRVLNWNGWRVQGVLATSRSLGDHGLKPYVTSEPEVNVVTRSEMDEFLIIATDGLFDVVGNELACELAKKYLMDRQEGGSEAAGPAEAAAALAELAIAKGSRDNISVIVVQLK
ncbi:protein phosphatase 2C 51-like isoform X2 [Andrographis paniculata]|uniref:protein phosphatase 2C 51-like isoform X2 n=1 Tax=Andrographis paniculata TaxID=175694 RepID=UPI0021E89B10|nr:protein phosphatase 2C 51-like isoform X2 [Andrographis paniculata]